MQDARLNGAPEPAALIIDDETRINGAEGEFQLLAPPVVVSLVSTRLTVPIRYGIAIEHDVRLSAGAISPDVLEHLGDFGFVGHVLLRQLEHIGVQISGLHHC